MGADEAVTRKPDPEAERQAGDLTEAPPEKGRGRPGRVLELLPNATVRVELDNRAEVLAHFAGATVRNFVRVRVGDPVLVELASQDPARGRIVKLLPKKP
jgi:translation initiation factor IF-1